MTPLEKLNSITEKNNSLLCIGLDSDVNKIPKHLRGDGENSIFEFNRAIIDATHDLVCAYKPNTAFYEASGVDGIWQLRQTMMYLRQQYPDIYIILDAKRADIGSTNNGYVRFAFDFMGADAVTLHPYLGSEALKPFLDREDKTSIILCRTSNPGSGEFQDLKIDGKELYKHVAEKVTSWNTKNNLMMVVGATYPDEIAEVRKIAGDMTLLVPGIGAQGGDVEKTVKAGLNSKKAGLIISASRSVIFASEGVDFAEKARSEAMKLRDEINKYR